MQTKQDSDQNHGPAEELSPGWLVFKGARWVSLTSDDPPRSDSHRARTRAEPSISDSRSRARGSLRDRPRYTGGHGLWCQVLSSSQGLGLRAMIAEETLSGQGCGLGTVANTKLGVQAP